MLATALVIAPFALIAGVMVQTMNKYRPANVVGWVLILIGFGLLTLLNTDISTGKWVGYQIVAASGIGMIVGMFLHILNMATNDSTYVLVRCYNLSGACSSTDRTHGLCSCFFCILPLVCADVGHHNFLYYTTESVEEEASFSLRPAISPGSGDCFRGHSAHQRAAGAATFRSAHCIRS